MAETVTAIQTKVRWESRDSSFSLTDTNGLSLTNTIYRRLAAIIPWPELHRTDTSAATALNTEAVTWPSVKFIDVTQIEMQDPSDSSDYKTIVPARTELEWSLEREKTATFPTMYKRGNDGTQNVIQFAPAPTAAALSIRITGQIEPTEVTAGASETVFISQTPDDALAYLIAADVADKRNQPQRSQALVRKAAELLSAVSGREITPAELKSDTESG